MIQLLWPATIGAAVIVIIAGHLLGERKHPDPANTPGPGTSPVPGQSPSPVDGQPVTRLAGRAPAPVTHGPIDYRLTVWECGRIRMWDGQGQLRGGRDCITHVDWDAELRAETEGQP